MADISIDSWMDNIHKAGLGPIVLAIYRRGKRYSHNTKECNRCKGLV